MSTASERKKWRCPGCEKVYSIPHNSELSLCPDCQRSQARSSQPPLSSTESDTDTKDPFPRERHLPREQSALKAQQAAPTSSRYPNLNRHLKSQRLIAKILLVFAIVVAGIAVLVLVIGALVLGISNPRENWFDSIRVIFVALIFAAIVVGVAWEFYVIIMAVVEFIHVIIDIEQNTRSIAEKSDVVQADYAE